MIDFLLFCLSATGMTHIIVDSYIFSFFRKWADDKFPNSLGKMVSCSLCTGFWAGMFNGLILMSYKPNILFACGCAGSFLAMSTTIFLNYLEAISIVSLDENEH